MNPRVESVQPNARDYTILIRFTSQEERLFDVRPYLDKGFFRELQDAAYFKRAKVVLGTVQWPHGQDFCPDTLYELSEPVTEFGVVTMIDSF